MAKQTGSPHTRILKELKKKQIKKIEVTNTIIRKWFQFSKSGGNFQWYFMFDLSYEC